MMAGSIRQPYYFTDLLATYQFCGDLGFTCTHALRWVLLFESPIIRLERILFRSRGGRDSDDRGKSPIISNSHHFHTHQYPLTYPFGTVRNVILLISGRCLASHFRLLLIPLSACSRPSSNCRYRRCHRRPTCQQGTASYYEAAPLPDATNRATLAV